MAATLEALPDQVRTHVHKMRDLVRIIENARLNEVANAIENLKVELDTLMAIANKASGRRA